MQSAAILIGLNTYPDTARVTALRGAVNDCLDMADMFTRHRLVAPDHVYTYLYDTSAPPTPPPQSRTLVPPAQVMGNGTVGRDTLISILGDTVNRLGRDGFERLYIYLSGHGGDITNAIPPVSALIWTDFTSQNGFSNLGLLVTDHLQNIVHNAPRIREAVIITDCCRLPLPALTQLPMLGPAPAWKPGTRCLTIKSAVHSQPSVESALPGSDRFVGEFTRALIDVIDEAMTTPGTVLWRDICDRVAATGAGRRIEYQQLASYPLMELRPEPDANPSIPDSAPAALRPGRPGTTGAVDRAVPARLWKEIQALYDQRPLVNGIDSLHQLFPYLNEEQRRLLQLARDILSTEGTPSATTVLARDITAVQVAAVQQFLNDQIWHADPLHTVAAPSQQDGFNMNVTGVRPDHKGDAATIRLEVTRPPSSHSPGVQFYNHPTTVPVYLDVPFVTDTVTVELDLWGVYTVVAQVYGGPLLKLDLATIRDIPEKIRLR